MEVAKAVHERPDRLFIDGPVAWLDPEFCDLGIDPWRGNRSGKFETDG